MLGQGPERVPGLEAQELGPDARVNTGAETDVSRVSPVGVE